MFRMSILETLAAGRRVLETRWRSAAEGGSKGGSSLQSNAGSAGSQWAIELVILLALLNLVAMASVGPQRLGEISPHPYWIPVVLMSCQHGTLAGIAAAVSAMGIQWLTGTPAPAGNEDLYDYLYRVWREPMLWLVATVVIGGLRGQQTQRLESVRLRLAAADERLQSIGGYADTLRGHCEMLERHIACTSDRSIEAGLAVCEEVADCSYEALDSALPPAMDLLFGASSYTLLTLRDGRLSCDPKLSRTLPEAARLPQVPQLQDALVAELGRSRRVLSIRNGDDYDLLGGVSLLAAPVISLAGDRLIGVLLVQTMDVTRLHAATERSMKHLAQQLAHPMSRQRVVVEFQRDRHASRGPQPGDEATAFGHTRAAVASVQDARLTAPE